MKSTLMRDNPSERPFKALGEYVKGKNSSETYTTQLEDEGIKL